MAVFNWRVASDCLLAEQGVICAIASSVCCTWVSASGIVANIKMNKQATWLDRLIMLSGTFFDLLDTSWSGSWGSLAKEYP